MSKIGRKDVLGIGKEASFGAGQTPDTYIPVDDMTYTPIFEKVNDTGAIGRIESHSDSEIATQHSEISAGGIVRDQSFGHLLLAALGSVSTSGPADSAYTHTFTVKNDQVPVTYQMEIDGGDIETAGGGKILGATLQSLDIDILAEDYAKFASTWVGKTMETTPDGTPAFSAENIFVGKHIGVKLASAISGLGAASAVPVKSGKITIAKNADPEFGTGSADPSSIPNKTIEFSGELELFISNATYHDLTKNGTKNAIRIEMTNTGVTIGASTNPSLTIDLAQCAFDWGHAGGNDDLRTQTVTFSGEYSLSDSKAITIDLVNEKTSY